ncbi:MAG TPA: ribosome biogenesis GTP-binding protein YihA/YsxC [Gammaproteobacteria bacterium]|jgi:GTP-binding protein|nr:ribosome biogenesis GTP-binding protein YihA/YsxC [Gammaproteobacteria bacterium]
MHLDFRNMRFLTSAAALGGLPSDTGREVAFAGRSNAGKSSALNAITGVNGLARVSKTPGRTRLLNLFGMDGGMRFMDLPGYGYAKVPEAERLKWGQLVEGYLSSRQSLVGLILVMDSRHPLMDFDKQLLGFAGPLELPVHVLLSKADKLSRGAAAKTLAETTKGLRGWGTAQLFSAHSGQGVEEAQKLLAGWLSEDEG